MARWFAVPAPTIAVYATRRLMTWQFSLAIKPFAPTASAAVTAKRKLTIYSTLEQNREFFAWAVMRVFWQGKRDKFLSAPKFQLLWQTQRYLPVHPNYQGAQLARSKIKVYHPFLPRIMLMSLHSCLLCILLSHQHNPVLHRLRQDHQDHLNLHLIRLLVGVFSAIVAVRLIRKNKNHPDLKMVMPPSCPFLSQRQAILWTMDIRALQQLSQKLAVSATVFPLNQCLGRFLV